LQKDQVSTLQAFAALFKISTSSFDEISEAPSASQSPQTFCFLFQGMLGGRYS